MVSAYPGLFYPGQVHPSDVDTAPPPPPPPTDSGSTAWGSWLLTDAGTWLRRETRVLVWPGTGAAAPTLTAENGDRLTTETGAHLTF